MDERRGPRIFLGIINAILALAGVAAIILASIFLKYSPLMWILLIFGIIFVALPFLVIIGACSDRSGCCSKFSFATSIFVSFFVVLIGVVAAIAFWNSEGLYYSFIGTETGFNQLQNVTKVECDGTELQCMDDIITKASSFTKFAPIILLVILVVVLVSAFFMLGIQGRSFLSRVVLSFVSLLILVLGAGLLVIGIMFLVAAGKTSTPFITWCFIIFIIVGAFLVLAALLGYFGCCCKATPIHVIYIIIVSVCTIALLVFSIVAAVMPGKIAEQIEKDEKMKETLLKVFTQAMKLKTDEMKLTFLTHVLVGLLRLVAVVGFCFAAYLVCAIIASSVKMCCRYDEGADGLPYGRGRGSLLSAD
ncbi:hypothetical protein BLNAU_15294 [Blattamonas nauphoetae]|uniref:Uncharacterized protein n=1 Tax=Blattamonas nauphoetae TaxID=2049346 RepID=A0ABQ9XHQ5_9EUKA|nr:hypothetical protein BLNAU_15294 [Blattamonas nauphoetae]